MRSIFQNPTARRLGIALAALVWNGMVFALIKEQMDPVAAQTLTDDYRDFIDIRPIWELAAANLTYVAGLLGALLMAANRRSAVWAFGLSTLAAAITVIPTFVLGPAIIGAIMVVVTLVAALFTWLARKRFR